MLLSYRSNGASGGGYSLEMTLANLSDKDVASWELALSVSGKVTLTDFWGFIPVAENGLIRVYPGSGTETMEPYQSRVGSICMNPLEEPLAMDATVHYADGSETNDASPTPFPVVTGSLMDDPILLTYRSTEPSKGGKCLEMTFSNLSQDVLKTWSVQLTMTGVVYLTDFWGVAPSAAGSLITVYPGQGAQTMDPGESRVGTICMNPLETPLVMLASVTHAVQDSKSE